MKNRKNIWKVTLSFISLIISGSMLFAVGGSDDNNKVGPDEDTQIVDVLNPATGKTWMDRNLGASRVATSSTDAEAYGDLYQWGRAADGHQKRTSDTTSTLSDGDNPGHGDFILSTWHEPVYQGEEGVFFDWRSPRNNNLWQGVNGVNNPCPPGYRLPTEAELEEERQSWISNDAAGAFASPLKLPMTGSRNGSSGSLDNVGSSGGYWSITVSNIQSKPLQFGRWNANHHPAYRATGLSVRCIKD